MAGQRNIKWKLNADFELVTRWKSDGVPQEVTGGTLQVRSTDNADGEPLLEVAATLDGAPNHWVRFVKLKDEFPIDIEEGSAIYDVVVTYGASRTKDLLEGAVVISKGVTR